MKTIVALQLAASSIALLAQEHPHPQFDIVSIKRVDEVRDTGGMRTLPDGTFMMMNQPMGSLVNLAAPVPLRDVVGMPDWMTRDRYDVTVKPPAVLTLEQRREQWPLMWRAMFADRMKLEAHVEQRERDVFALVLAREDGRLGPNLKPSTLDCTPRPPDAAAASPPQGLPDRQNRCGLSMSAGLIVSGGITMDRLVPSLRGLAGGEVENRTGLQGDYAVTLRFSAPRQPNADAPIDDAPEFFTALREQLGLKLERSKKMMPVFVIDHIERPSEN